MGQKLGQHFLRSEAIARQIVASADITPRETVLEIGPGKGVLTGFLLNVGADVVAVEKDLDLAELLRNKFADEVKAGKLKLVEADIRDFLPSSQQLRSGGYKLVANIPYYITGELLRRYLSSNNQPDTIVFLVQNEVAKRVVAHSKPDGRPNESILSISVKAYGKPTLVKKVPKRYFSPPPKVDSAILKIEDISKDFFINLDEEWFFKVLKTGFSQKRKKLINNLEKIADKSTLLGWFDEMGINSNARPEDVSLEGWRVIALKLVKLI